MNRDGYRVAITQATVFRPGEWDGPALTVGRGFIEDGIVYTSIGGAPPGSARLAVGESHTFPGIGTFTLLEVDFSRVQPFMDGAGSTAIFSFVPDPDFKLDPVTFPDA